jgi:hypothetical protein
MEPSGYRKEIDQVRKRVIVNILARCLELPQEIDGRRRADLSDSFVYLDDSSDIRNVEVTADGKVRLFVGGNPSANIVLTKSCVWNVEVLVDLLEAVSRAVKGARKSKPGCPHLRLARG